jgi:hypothetical protein
MRRFLGQAWKVSLYLARIGALKTLVAFTWMLKCVPVRHLQHYLHHRVSSPSRPRGLKFVSFEYVIFGRWEIHLEVEEIR